MFQYIQLEYNAMRDEIKTAHSHIFLTMQISLGFIGALLVVAFDNLESFYLTNMIMCILVPIMCAAALSFMLAESIRMKRAGEYICLLEKKCENEFFNNEDNTNITLMSHKAALSGEEMLRIGVNTCIDLSRPLAFEQWIRDRKLKKSFYGRASFLLQFRFIVFFLIGVGIFFFATYYQFIATDKGIWISSHYLIHIIGATIAIPWFLIIIYYGMLVNGTRKFLRFIVTILIMLMAVTITICFILFASVNLIP